MSNTTRLEPSVAAVSELFRNYSAPSGTVLSLTADDAPVGMYLTSSANSCTATNVASHPPSPSLADEFIFATVNFDILLFIEFYTYMKRDDMNM